jgi:predicted ATPase
MNGPRTKPLRFTRIRLENWRNFTRLDLELQRRVFLVGANASGKSNFLDVFRFLHDVASVGGGFQAALQKPWRGGVARLKSLAGRHHAGISLHVRVGDDKKPAAWEYELAFAQDAFSLPMIQKERVLKNGKEVLLRPDGLDKKDRFRLTQTFLEQGSVNQEFRPLAEFFASTSYLHLVPQAVRGLLHAFGTNDPYGTDLLRRMADLPEAVRNDRLSLVRDALRAAVPQLKELEFWFDPVEKRPHLRASYEHMEGTWQLEDQFSDGTLRLLGLLWAFGEGGGPLLLEEPELSLHRAVVRLLPILFAGLQVQSGRQVLVSTHSADLLHEEGIGLNEVVVLEPGPEGSVASLAGDNEQTSVLVESGLDMGEAVLPRTAPRNALDLVLAGARRPQGRRRKVAP